MGEPNVVRSWQRDAQNPDRALHDAKEDVFVALGGNGNVPYRCLANAVDNAVKALELGLSPDDLDVMPEVGRLPGDERIVEAFRIVASAVEGEALRRWRAEPVTA